MDSTPVSGYGDFHMKRRIFSLLASIITAGIVVTEAGRGDDRADGAGGRERGRPRGRSAEGGEDRRPRATLAP